MILHQSIVDVIQLLNRTTMAKRSRLPDNGESLNVVVLIKSVILRTDPFGKLLGLLSPYLGDSSLNLGRALHGPFFIPTSHRRKVKISSL